MTGVAATAVVASTVAPTAASAAPGGKGHDIDAGVDLTGFNVHVGDGIWVGPEEGPVTDADIAAVHHGSYSELVANATGRGVMAHAIASTKLRDLPGIDLTHEASVEFRIPELPHKSIQRTNAQTLEAGLIVWDGSGTRLDYGVAVQWSLNPWSIGYGAIRTWSTEGGWEGWKDVSHLEPDTEWHTLALKSRPGTELSNLFIDGRPVKIDSTAEPKHDWWGNTIDGRFRVELISLWPGAHSSLAPAKAEFRNWTWSRLNL